MICLKSSFKNSLKSTKTGSVFLLLTSSMLGCSPLHPAFGAEPTKEEIFEKVFKKKLSAVTAEIQMPVFYENASRPLGQVKTQVGATPEDLKMETKTILAYLDRLIEPDQGFKPLVIEGSGLGVQHFKDEEWIPLSAFKGESFQVEYYEDKLEIRLRIPPEMRRIRTVSLRHFEDDFAPITEVTLQPSNLSGFVNATASQDFLFENSNFGTNTSARQPLRLQLDQALNFRSTVLESSASYYENTQYTAGTPAWTRGNVRLVHDSPSSHLRKTVGDLTYPITGFQYPLALGGAAVYSVFTLEPNKVTSPAGKYEIFLKRKSKIVVLNNGTPIKEFELPAGRHNIKDFPFYSGQNDIKLIITDDVGQTETLEFSQFFSNELLDPGLSQISYAVGAPSSISTGFYRYYDSKNLTGSFYHRLGLTSLLTGGVNLQINQSQHLAGAEALLSTSLGYFRFEPAISGGKAIDPGFALRGQYLWTDERGKNQSPRSLTLGVETRSPHFNPMNTANLLNPTQYDLSATYGQTLGDKTSASLAFGYQINRKTAPNTVDSGRVAGTLSRRWGSGINTSLNLQQSMSSIGTMDTQLTVFLVWSLYKERQTVVSSYNLKNDAIRVDWNYSGPNQGVGAHSVKLGTQRGNDVRGFDSQIQYTANRMQLAFNQNTKWILPSTTSTAPTNTTPTNLLNFQAATALVYAGGQFAISRPVSDSFMIVAPEKNLWGQTIDLAPQYNDGAIARTDWLGAAAINELGSYNYATVKLGTKKLKPGTEIGHDTFTVFPTYKSGYVVHLGTDATTSLGLRLLQPDGTPLALQPGKIRSLSDSSWTEVTMFTSKSGKTRVDGFKPGKYELRLFDDTWEPLVFEIPEETEGLFDLGAKPMKKKSE